MQTADNPDQDSQAAACEYLLESIELTLEHSHWLLTIQDGSTGYTGKAELAAEINYSQPSSKLQVSAQQNNSFTTEALTRDELINKLAQQAAIKDEQLTPKDKEETNE